MAAGSTRRALRCCFLVQNCLINWYCFYYSTRNSLKALLEVLFARIFLDLRSWYAINYMFSVSKCRVVFAAASHQGKLPQSMHPGPICTHWVADCHEIEIIPSLPEDSWLISTLLASAELIYVLLAKSFPELKIDGIPSVDCLICVWAFLHVDDMVLIPRSYGSWHVARDGRWDTILGLNDSSSFSRIFERPTRLLETQKARNESNSRDRSQIGCKNQTVIRCRLQIMQKETRTTLCEHWKIVGGDIWAHQQCLLQQNGNTLYGCTSCNLQTSEWQHQKHTRVTQ